MKTYADIGVTRSEDGADGDVLGICPPKSTMQLTLHKPLVRRQDDTVSVPDAVNRPPPLLTARSVSSVETCSTCNNTPPTSARSKRRYSFDISATAEDGGKTSRSCSMEDDTYYFCTSPTDEEYPCQKRSTPQNRQRSPAPDMAGVYCKEETPFTFFHPDFELQCALKEEI